MSNYFEICQAIASYLVAALGIVGLIALLGLLILFVIAIGEVILVRSGELMKAWLLRFSTMEDFREFRRMKQAAKAATTETQP